MISPLTFSPSESAICCFTLLFTSSWSFAVGKGSFLSRCFVLPAHLWSGGLLCSSSSKDSVPGRKLQLNLESTTEIVSYSDSSMTTTFGISSPPLQCLVHFLFCCVWMMIWMMYKETRFTCSEMCRIGCYWLIVTNGKSELSPQRCHRDERLSVQLPILEDGFWGQLGHRYKDVPPIYART